MQLATDLPETVRTRGRGVAWAGVLALLLGLLPASSGAAQSLPDRCGADIPEADFDDRAGIADTHVRSVDCVAYLGIAEGLGSDTGVVYLPDVEVRRDQMASFVARMLVEAGAQLPEPDHRFSDVDVDDVHADPIGRLAAAGIVGGVSAERYAPGDPVRRDQMASFLNRAVAYHLDVELDDLQGGAVPFEDVAVDGTHRANIAGAYHLGITRGTTADRYDPQRTVTRETMATFLVRSLDAMTNRDVVADRDGGGLPHTVYTFPSESGRCFQVKAGNAWTSACEPESDATLQVRTIAVDDGFAVATGLVTSDVTRVEVEYDGDASLALELTDLGSTALRAWASPIAAADIDAVVAYVGDTEVARTTPDDPTGPPFPVDTAADEGEGTGAPVTLVDVAFGHHETYDRTVLEVDGGGHAGWDVAYVDVATAQGSGLPIELEGDAILRVTLTNMAYPADSDVASPYAPGTRLAGTDHIREAYVGTTFEGSRNVFIGLDHQAPFRVFSLDDPERIVVDVAHIGA